jgi:energy-converting hydrogenase B subunit D
MTVLVLIAITLVGVAATIVALTQRPEAQALMLSVFGLTLTVLFVVLQAPDVALSQLVIGAVVVPLMLMLAFRTVNRDSEEANAQQESQQ